MTITELLDQFCLDKMPSKSYLWSLKRTVKRAGEFGITTVDHLQSDKVNRWLAILSTQFSRTTVSNVRREICTLWNYAHREHLTDTLPVRVVRVKPQQRPPRAWTADDLAAMYRAASSDQERCGGLQNPTYSDWLPAWILIGYDTGLRFSDIYNLTERDVVRNTISIVAAKTGKPLVRSMSEPCVRDVQELIGKSQSGSLFSGMLTRRRAFLCWRKFLDKNNFEGSSRWLRRSCATYLEMQGVGNASSYLQHSSPHLAARHYIDQSIIGPATGPPRLKVG